MAGVTPLVPPRAGVVEGKLGVKAETPLTLEELFTHLPETKAFLGEVTKKGWKYYYIDGYGTVQKEMEITSPYRFLMDEHPRGGFTYCLSVEFGRQLPKALVTAILKLDRFVVNICSEDYPRAVTVDIANKQVSYVHDCLWEKKGEGCKREAQRVLKILQWFIEDKKFKLGDGGSARYKELVKKIGEK